ncbi:uncharacterized protein [Aegilops tauschii subsp. strangulata]|uniref:uncharacterized protein n=1 Tax=Aegilops tauschii subsp. strangulata TaxID=200361 RepID=UPI00098B4F11|nr:uncharacterized protein LOC109763018 [Aegilops tauschii subsp. strangulata]
MAYGNLDLVVNQVMKEWDIRSPAMTGYCNTVRKLQKHFEGLELRDMPCLKNQAADDLAKMGSTQKPIPKNVFLEHLHSPTIKEDPFVEEPPQPELPEDEDAARKIVRPSKAFTVMGDQLYKKNTTAVTQRCISPEEGQQILQEIHSKTCGHHASSQTLVAKAFRAAFYWP